MKIENIIITAMMVGFIIATTFFAVSLKAFVTHKNGATAVLLDAGYERPHVSVDQDNADCMIFRAVHLTKHTGRHVDGKVCGQEITLRN